MVCGMNTVNRVWNSEMTQEHSRRYAARRKAQAERGRAFEAYRALAGVERLEVRLALALIEEQTLEAVIAGRAVRTGMSTRTWAVVADLRAAMRGAL